MCRIGLLIFTCLFALGGCASQSQQTPHQTSAIADQVSSSSSQAPESEIELPQENVGKPNSSITVSIGDQVFSATLSDTEAAKTFQEMLPLTLEMQELNQNEKYFHFDQEFPTDDYFPSEIQCGDLMLYNGSYVVLFYQTFTSSYRYTDLGRIDDPSGLAEAVGQGNVTVTFSLE